MTKVIPEFLKRLAFCLKAVNIRSMKNFKKTAFLSLSIGVGTLLVLAAVAPFLIDVDKFRPDIVRLANQNLNGSLELGKLKLNLWGKIAVGVEKAALSDTRGKTLLSVADCELVLPLSKWITAQPEVQIRLKNPMIQVERTEEGSWNLMKIAKASETAESAQKEIKTEPKEAAGEASSVPSWLRRAGVSLWIQGADLSITDPKTQSHYELKSLNVKTGLLSMQTLPTFSLNAQVDTRIGKTGQVLGSFEIQSKGQGNGLKVEGDFNKLGISFGEKINKKAGIPLKLQVLLVKDNNSLRIEDGDLVVDEAKARFKGAVKKPEGEGQPLQGNLSLALSGVQFRGPYFKQELALKGEAEVTFDSIDKAVFELKGKGINLALNAKVNSFSEPKVAVEIQSSELDLDELFDWKAMKAAAKNPAQPEAQPEHPKNASEKQIGSPGPAEKAVGTVGIKIKTLKAYNVSIEPVNGSFSLRNLKLSGGFEEAKVLGGQLVLKAQLDASTPELNYDFQAQVKNVSLEKAVASQVDWLKSTVTGAMSGDMSGRGSGADAVQAKKNLRATGKIQIKPAKFSTIDINQIVVQSVKGPLSKVAEKIPSLRGKELKIDPVTSDFQQVSASFSITEGRFLSPDFYAEAVPGKGVELRGETRVGLLDYDLGANWEVSDPYNVLKMKEVSVEEGGFRVESILVEKGKPFRIPVRVHGNLFKPEYDYGSVPESLTNIALKNISLAAQDRAKSELKKQAQEKIKELTDKAPAPVQQILKGIFK